jgi:hypothetical protein
MVVRNDGADNARNDWAARFGQSTFNHWLTVDNITSNATMIMGIAFSTPNWGSSTQINRWPLLNFKNGSGQS